MIKKILLFLAIIVLTFLIVDIGICIYDVLYNTYDVYEQFSLSKRGVITGITQDPISLIMLTTLFSCFILLLLLTFYTLFFSSNKKQI